MKRPSFQFYPGDWLRSSDLRACSIAARGLWVDMLCLMHEGNPYGYLRVGQRVIHPLNLARMVGVAEVDIEKLLSELSTAGVFSVDEDGCIFSRRMVRDERTREFCASAGKLGGNPKLVKPGVNPPHKPPDKATLERMVKAAVKPMPTPPDKPNLTAASASALQHQGFNTTTNNETRAPDAGLEVKTNGPQGPPKANGKTEGDDWWLTSAGIAAKGKELGLQPEYRETDRSFKDRIFKVLHHQKASP